MILDARPGLQASNSSPHLTTSTLQLDVVAMAEQDLETIQQTDKFALFADWTSSREFESQYEQANLDNAARVRALRRKLTHLSTHRNSALRRYSLVTHRLRGIGLWKSQKAKWNASQLGYGSYNY